MLRRVRFFIWCAVAVFPAAVASAQGDTTSSYDGSALRVESHWGDLRILRGSNGAVVGKIGTFSSVDLTKLVGRSDSALKQAREFNRNHGPGSWASAIGGIALGVCLAISAHNDEASWGLVSTEVAATGLLLYGGIRLNRAYNALSRSIWWYNRDLKH